MGSMGIRGVARRGRRGAATVMALLVTFTLMVMCAAFFQLGTSGQKRMRSAFDDERALNLAETGLAESLTALRAGATGNVGNQGTPAYFGGGVFWSSATDLGGGLADVTVTAMIGSGRSAVRAVLDKNAGDPPLFETVLNSDSVMTLNQGVVIDSYQSSLGDYSLQATNSYSGTPYAKDGGDARSNEDVVMNNDAMVFGDATPGPGYTVTTASGSYVSGSTAPAATPFTFDPITPPTVTSAGDYSLTGATPAVLPSGTYGFDAFSIGNGSNLTVQGPATVVVDSFTGNKNGRLLIDATNGPVTFYVAGTYTQIKDFQCDAVTGSPMALAFFVEGSTDIVFPSYTPIRGAYYVPNAAITFSNGNECWGAFAGKGITMSNNMKFHFDEDLMNYWRRRADDGQSAKAVLAWARAAVPDRFLADRRDPMLVLGVDRRNLPSPADAWDLVAGGGGGTLP